MRFSEQNRGGKQTGLLVGLFMGMCLMMGCQKDGVLDEESNRLPDGRFPIVFEAVQGCSSASSRITEDPNGIQSFWSEGDQVGIAIRGGRNDATFTGTLTSSGQMTHETLYWQTKANAMVTGWYPANDGVISLTNQKRRLVYLLKTEGKEYNYLSGPIGLEFHHQLAKVRIILTGNFSWLRFAELSILGYRSCTLHQGTFSFDSEKEYINMRSIRSKQRVFEANVPPMLIKAGEDVLKITYWKYQKMFTMDKDLTLKAGHLYQIEMDANWFH